MNNIFLTIKKIMRDSRNSLFWMIFASLIVGGIMVAIYPSIKDAGEDLVNYMDTFPQEFLDAFGITSLDMSVFEVYISTEYFSFFWAMVFIPFLISWTSMFAKSAEDGTMGLLLSYPISRVELLVSYLIDAILKSLLIAFVMVGTVVLFGYFFGIEPDLVNWLKFTLVVSLLLAVVGVVTVLLSVLIRRRGATVGIAAGLVLASYFINVISKLYEELESIKYLSLFHYFGDPVDILLDGRVESLSIIYFIGVIFVGIFLSLYLGRRIELPKG